MAQREATPTPDRSNSRLKVRQIVSSRRLWLWAILLVAAFLRLWQIDTIPPGFHFDESFEGLEAWRILTEPDYRPIFLTGNFGVPPLNAYFNAITFYLFDLFGGQAGPTAMRTTAAVSGLLGVLLIYMLAVELSYFDRKERLSSTFPLFAAAVLAIMRWHLHFSRMGIEPIYVPLVWTGALWLLLRGWRTSSWASFAGSGFFLAAGMYAYQSAWFIPLLMIPIALHLLLDARQPRITNHESPKTKVFGLFITATVAALLFAPLGWFFLNNIDLIFLRPTQLVIVGETGSPADSTFLSNVWATAKMFGPFGTPGDLDPRRNIPGFPAINLWLVIPFYLGLVLSIWRLRMPTYSILLLGLIGLVAPGVFTEYAPHFHRILGAAAPVALLCGVGLDALWTWRPQQGRQGVQRQAWLRWASIVLLIAAASTSTWNYFGRWATLPDLFYAFDEGLWDAGQWMAQQPAETRLYLTPRNSEHATLAFALETAPQERPQPISFDGRHIFPLTDQGNPQSEAYIAIEHEDFRTPLMVPGVLPAANIVREIVDGDDNTYARIYQRPIGSAAARPPQNPLQAALGDGISMIGYDVQPVTLHPGKILYLQLHWLVDTAPGESWTVFTHLLALGEDGSATLVAGHDSIPGAGSLPTTNWLPGMRILDEYQIALPAELRPGAYQLTTGLYLADGTRLPVDGRELTLGTVQLEAP